MLFRQYLDREPLIAASWTHVSILAVIAGMTADRHHTPVARMAKHEG